MVSVFQSIGLPPNLVPKLPPNTNEKSFRAPELPMLESSYRLESISLAGPGVKKALFSISGSSNLTELPIPIDDIVSPQKLHRAYRSHFVSTLDTDRFLSGLLQDHIAGFDVCIVLALNLKD